MLDLLKVEPVLLEGFLTMADLSVRKANDMLRSPGTDVQILRTKVDGVFREMHALKGEALALGLGAFGRHIHAIEDLLSGLRERADLTGNEFLPVAVKLNELMDYRTQIIELKEKVSQFRDVANLTAPREDVFPGMDANSRGAAEQRAQRNLPALLSTLTESVAADCHRSVQLVTSGLDSIPSAYAVRVRGICIQMIRNAVVHGIEKSAERRSVGKSPTATITLSFGTEDPEYYVLVVEDDGRGLNYEEIIDRAVRSGLVRPEQAATMKPEAVYKLILEPGFTTRRAVSIHAGLGVGLNVVSESLRECEGQLSIATKPGSYTRFTMRLSKQGIKEMQTSVV